MVMAKDDKKAKKTSMVVSGGDSQTSGLTSSKSGNTDELCLKKRLMALGLEVVLQRPRSRITKRRKMLGVEEQAAILLMALSCGSVFA